MLDSDVNFAADQNVGVRAVQVADEVEGEDDGAVGAVL